MTFADQNCQSRWNGARRLGVWPNGKTGKFKCRVWEIPEEYGGNIGRSLRKTRRLYRQNGAGIPDRCRQSEDKARRVGVRDGQGEEG